MNRIKITDAEGTERVLERQLFDEIADLNEDKEKYLKKLSCEKSPAFISEYSHRLEIVMEKLDALERIADRLVDYGYVEVAE